MVRVTDVAVGGITPAPVDSPRRRSRTVEVVELRMEVGVEILADLAVCSLSCKPFVFRVFFLAFELNIILRIFLCFRYLRTILALPVVDPGGPSMCLYSGPGSDSGVNEGLVPFELFWFIV